MCPERLVHNRERAGGKRVLARQACQRPGTRLPAALRGAARWTLAGWSSRSVVSSCGCAAPHSFPDSSCARGSPHRTDPAANTSRRRSARCSLLQHAQRVGAVVDRPGGHVGGRRRPAAAMTRSSATRPPRPSSCTCRECFCLRVWEFSGFCGRPVRACTWIGRVRARACVHMVYSASGMSIIVHRLCRSGAMWSCRQERTVKPSAQPTLVRTQHLPHPGETARWLRKRGPAGRFFSVTPCTRVCHRGSMHSGGYGQIADSVRAERAVRSGSCTCRELVMDLSCTCRIPALLTRRIAGLRCQ